MSITLAINCYLLLWLCGADIPDPVALINSFIPEPFKYRFYDATSCVVILAVVVYAIYWRAQFRGHIGGLIDLLEAAAFDLVKQIENCSAQGWKNSVKLDSEVAAKFAIEGAESIIRQSRLLASRDGLDPLPALSGAATAMVDYQRMRRTNFLQGRQQLRRGIGIFLLLVVMRNFQGAYNELVEYSRVQQDGWPSLLHLKLFFDLPAAWPGDEKGARLRSRSLTKWDEFVMRTALKRGAVLLNKALTLQLPDGSEARGAITLALMRQFLHVSLEDLKPDNGDHDVR